MFGKNNIKSDMEIFAMYDSKVETYEDPMYSMNQHDMVRQILNIFREPNSKSKYFINAEDYSLFKIGSYERKTGKLHTQNPEHIANMHDLRAVAQNQGIAST